VHPDGRRSVISRNESIVSHHPIDEFGEVDPGNGVASLRYGLLILVGDHFAVALDEAIAEMGVRFLVQPRDQCFERRLDVANQSSGRRMAAAQMGRLEVDLHDLRVFRIELPLGEIRAEQQQGVAFQNGVIGRLVPDDPGHADIVRIVVFEGVLSPG
jgi:hypothetical protein